MLTGWVTLRFTEVALGWEPIFPDALAGRVRTESRDCVARVLFLVTDLGSSFVVFRDPPLPWRWSAVVRR